MILAGTGHRPDKLGGYGNKYAEHMVVVTAIQRLIELQPTSVITGMAQGWDLALAYAALKQGIPYVAAIPFEGQESMWPENARHLYTFLRRNAAHEIVVCPGGYEPSKMQVRNMWMMDNCTHVLAMWNGTRGGTANCIKYAEHIKRPVMNQWDNLIYLYPELAK